MRIKICGMSEQRVIDVAIGWRDSASPELSCQPWRQSPLVCVMPGDPQESAQSPVDPRRLDCTKELYINWPPSFTQWHETYWPADQFHPSYVASAQLALQIMAHSGSWAVMPLFFAKYACQKGAFAYQYLTDPPEPLTAEDIDSLENYVLAKGIRGKNRWRKPFSFVMKSGALCDLERLNRVREGIYRRFEPLFAVFFYTNKNKKFVILSIDLNLTLCYSKKCVK